MRSGPNLLKLAKKEQCLALTTQLRTKFKLTPCFYRVFPDGKVQYLHPADGVYPEKVNAGRVGANQNMRRIGDNVNPIKVRTCMHARMLEEEVGVLREKALKLLLIGHSTGPVSLRSHQPSLAAGQVHRQGPR